MNRAVRLHNLSKTFDGTTVLDSVGFDIAPGEIHGLVGENGSGKSTLVKVLAGVHAPDPGGICELWGTPLSFPVKQPEDLGIAVIHQDLGLCDEMTVAENVGITSRYDTRLLSLYRATAQEDAVRRLSADFGISLDPKARVDRLAPAERSLVAIMRALRLLSKHPEGQVVILDEPTAALPHSESERLLGILRNLAASGAAVLFISHRLREVLDTCDRVSVLRSGQLVGTVEAPGTSENQLAGMMLGYEIGDFYPARSVPSDKKEVLSVRSLGGGKISDLSFSVGSGEIVGVTGLVGMGHDEIPYLINGYSPRATGQVTIGGKIVKPTVFDSLEAGLALVPGNRQRDSVWLAGTALENLTLPFLKRFQRRGVLRGWLETKFVKEEMDAFDVRPRRPSQPIARFSGGNQQKVVLARWLQMNPSVLLLHEPTQGVDAGAKKEIFGVIRKAAASGAAIAMFSSDIEEVAHVCDRVLVIRHGRVSTEVSRDELSVDRLIAASQGSQPTMTERQDQI